MGLAVSRQSFGFVALQSLAMLLLFCASSSGSYLAVIILAINALSITRIVAKNLILGKRSYLSMMFYILVCTSCFFPSWQSAMASFCLASSSWYITYSFRRQYHLDYVFRAGLLLGIAGLFAFESLFLLPSLIAGMWLSRRSLREVGILFVGYLLPALTFAYINWGVYDTPFLSFFIDGFNSVGWASCQCMNIYQYGYYSLIPLAIYAITLISSVFYIKKYWRIIRRRATRLSLFFVWQILVCLIIMIFSSSASIMALVAVPMSIIMPNVFVRGPQKFTNFLYIMMLLSALGFNVLKFFI